MSNNWWGKSLVSNKYVSIIRRDGVIHQAHETGTVSKKPSREVKDDPRVPRAACLSCGKKKPVGCGVCFSKISWDDYKVFEKMVVSRNDMGYSEKQIADMLGVKDSVVEDVLGKIYPTVEVQKIIKSIVEGEKHERI